MSYGKDVCFERMVDKHIWEFKNRQPRCVSCGGVISTCQCGGARYCDACYTARIIKSVKEAQS